MEQVVEQAELFNSTLVTGQAVTHLKSERVSVVPGLLQQGLVHGAQSGLVVLRVDLDMLDPDVLPEAQAHHIQVVTTIAEGTCQLHKHCQRTTVDFFFFLFVSCTCVWLWFGKI